MPSLDSDSGEMTGKVTLLRSKVGFLATRGPIV